MKGINPMWQMSNRLKHVAVIVIAAAIAGPSIATAQSPAHCVQTRKSAALPLQSVPEGCPSTKPSVASRRIVLLLVQGGTIGVTSSVIANGGGASSGGNFSINGTIAQPLAGGAITGSNFTATSGFWVADAATTSPKKRGGQVTSQD
jgi:hypothetical protein